MPDDLVIIGAGPAGLTAGIYVRMRIDFSGTFYTLNIFKKKSVGGVYDNPDRYTFFVPIEGGSNITMIQMDSFAILDGNGMDGQAIF